MNHLKEYYDTKIKTPDSPAFENLAQWQLERIGNTLSFAAWSWSTEMHNFRGLILQQVARVLKIQTNSK